jgi:hypothetical protein
MVSDLSSSCSLLILLYFLCMSDVLALSSEIKKGMDYSAQIRLENAVKSLSWTSGCFPYISRNMTRAPVSNDTHTKTVGQWSQMELIGA